MKSKKDLNGFMYLQYIFYIAKMAINCLALNAKFCSNGFL